MVMETPLVHMLRHLEGILLPEDIPLMECIISEDTPNTYGHPQHEGYPPYGGHPLSGLPTLQLVILEQQLIQVKTSNRKQNIGKAEFVAII